MTSTLHKHRLELCLFASPLMVLLFVFAALTWQRRSTKTLTTSVAYYPNTDLRERFAIKQIAAQLYTYPRTKVYIIQMPGNGVYADGLLTYERSTQKLTRRDIQPMGNGTTSWWTHVSVAAIAKAAARSASFNDMGTYGCKSMF